MTRDELILSFEDVVDNLVRKYNDGELDEDLHSEGMIKVIKAVDKCLSEGVTERENMIGRVIVWASNAILDIKRKPKMGLIDDFDLGEESYDIGYETLLIDVEMSLSETDKEIFNLLLEGTAYEDIQDMMGISKRTLYDRLNKIKKTILQK